MPMPAMAFHGPTDVRCASCHTPHGAAVRHGAIVERCGDQEHLYALQQQNHRRGNGTARWLCKALLFLS